MMDDIDDMLIQLYSNPSERNWAREHFASIETAENCFERKDKLNAHGNDSIDCSAFAASCITGELSPRLLKEEKDPLDESKEFMSRLNSVNNNDDISSEENDMETSGSLFYDSDCIGYSDTLDDDIGVKKPLMKRHSMPLPSTLSPADTGNNRTKPKKQRKLTFEICIDENFDFRTPEKATAGRIKCILSSALSSRPEMKAALLRSDQVSSKNPAARALFATKKEYDREEPHQESSSSPEDSPQKVTPANVLSRLELEAALKDFYRDPHIRDISDRLEDEIDDDDNSTLIKGIAREKQSSTRILRKWFLDHLDNPYPNLAEREWLLKQTALSRLQLRNWFTNCRKRCLKPLLISKRPRTQFEYQIFKRLQHHQQEANAAL